jgi:hypothetical protein
MVKKSENSPNDQNDPLTHESSINAMLTSAEQIIKHQEDRIIVGDKIKGLIHSTGGLALDGLILVGIAMFSHGDSSIYEDYKKFRDSIRDQ